MRSGGVVGTVQEKAACYRMPVPIRHLQPLSQGLSALPAPLTQGSQALRGDGASSEKKRSRAAHKCSVTRKGETMFTAIYLYRFMEGGQGLLPAMGIGAACYLALLLCTRLGRTKKGFFCGAAGLCIVALMCDVIWHLMYVEYAPAEGEAFSIMPGFLFWPLFLALMLLLVNIFNKMFE